MEKLIPPCPPNGLSRAQWFRWLAAEMEETDPQRAIYCRKVAGMIEQRVLGSLPLIARMGAADERQ